MKLEQAFNHLRENKKMMAENSQHFLGVAYTPGDEAEFQFLELELIEDHEIEQGYYYSVYLSGGNLLSSSGIEDYFSDESSSQVISDLPEFAHNLKYFVSTSSLMGFMSEYALKEIFPQLPDPSNLGLDIDVSVFKNQAIELINKTNNNQIKA